MKTPNNQLAQIALVVDDYDRAIDFYTRILGFDLVEDTRINEEKRWVVVRPQGVDVPCFWRGLQTHIKLLG